ncbi:MFS transporter [Streptomyces himalayensis]|uniref:MFS transporter n=1 Tax=Streptomyces himalayensis subsp. himalayensis TaxID=2756131 RepID=A0A7W0DS09_9ACTN|nr:MFS transporter [Streptomyces himalayensis]MBA2949755.1 MFS transporter [Streptomyces himalayensis subsp. himalayensis]
MRKWLPLTAVCLGAFMLLVDITIVTVALPDMAAALDTTFADLQWVMDGYALALAALLLGAGSLADRVGRRAVYLGGLVLFAAASLACALATGPDQLIAFRVVQGVGGAAMFATTMALLSGAYQGRDRGVAFGVWGAVNGAAAAAGPVLGGLLTEHLSWRWIFYVNLPITIVAVLVTVRAIKESRDPRAPRIDVPGMVAFTLAAGALTYGLIRAGDAGWGDGATLGPLAVSAVAAVVFVLIELRTPHPMLDLSLFRSRSFTAIMIGGVLLAFAAYSCLAYLSLWLQSVRGMGPVAAGLAVVPMSVAAFVVSALTGRFLHGVSPRLTIGGGLLLVGVGALLQSFVNADSTWTVLLPGLVVTGIGVGMSTPVMASAAMAQVAWQRAGMAGGALNTGRQLGNALGIALLGAVFQAGLLRVLHDGHALPDAERAAGAVSGGRAQSVIADAAPQERASVAHEVHAAFASGLQDALLLAGCAGLLGGVIVLVLMRRPDPAADSQGHRPAAEPAAAAPAGTS